MPTAVSPNATSLPKKPSMWLSIRNWMKLRYQSYVIGGFAGPGGTWAIRCQNATMPLPS